MVRHVAPDSARLRTISESQFQKAVVDCAMFNGWRVHFVPDVLYRRSFATSNYGANQGDKGFPDLVLCRGDRCIVAELKSMAGRIRPEQQAWLDDLSQIPGIDVRIWRPSDMTRIMATLAATIHNDTITTVTEAR